MRCSAAVSGTGCCVTKAENAGEPMATRTAWRLCQANGWHSAFGTKRGKNGRRPGPPVHDDRVKRQFTAQGMNQLWLTDITKHPAGEGKLYLCTIKDLYAGRIVGYSMAGCVVHPNRGSQFRSNLFQDALSRQDRLGRLPPVEYEMLVAPTTAHAA